ncbi:MAG: 5-formyltetrahydrofolate cyclo-ligase [Bacilli bacterium]|jgi:5-formyltetrahydrofolate cyclo-ligase
METKDQIRQRMIQTRKALRPEEVQSRSQALVKQIQAHPAYRQAKLIGAYYPLGNEVDLRALFKDGKRIALPKVVGSNLQFIELTVDTPLAVSGFGIVEPAFGPDVGELIDLLLVPALALDAANYRIGFGKGYYDRFLKEKRPPFVYGVAYDFQYMKAVPHADHDVPLDGCFLG